ncbi:hypothetical protein BJ138DRAFT_1149369 [Hygrophoropsis aurantiaca]|uniref:Uncharacterized protein n=1 Tax=Hygrophoropsis aurantiaca TaxID=72124 RepID=A0ACB8AFI5_9AGAM|nr:hypothetical protein BJ138DRAFT_1149369 [Hygrophoropsis aurantiaca]
MLFSSLHGPLSITLFLMVGAMSKCNPPNMRNVEWEFNFYTGEWCEGKDSKHTEQFWGSGNHHKQWCYNISTAVHPVGSFSYYGSADVTGFSGG